MNQKKYGLSDIRIRIRIRYVRQFSYAYLKNQLGERQYVPKRAGAISEETRYVLDYFKVEDPELITDVGAQLKDISIRKTAGISSQISLKKAWKP